MRTSSLLASLTLSILVGHDVLACDPKVFYCDEPEISTSLPPEGSEECGSQDCEGDS